MRNIPVIFLHLFAAIVLADVQVAEAAIASQKESSKDIVRLNTTLKESTFKRDVPDAFIVPYDADGNPMDTIRSEGYVWTGVDLVRSANLWIPVSRNDSVIVFDAGASGCQTQTITWTIEPFGKNEHSRRMPDIFLSKVRQLKDVTVTASKVKFYNKGDTIVYNADAFELAEGSMLDALISQLPGTKIDEYGRITVNGEFVESLLLNGKDFFNGDHSLMLDNLPAYTVKAVEVYKGHSKEEKLRFDTTKPTHLTMDVKLKKEYSIGWLLNLQAGYGTSDRYLTRAFASWFSPTTAVILTGAANNLNDNRTQGQYDSWTPDMMPSGRQAHREVGINYRHESTDRKVDANGSVKLSGGSTDNSSSTSATLFLTGGDSYERRFSDMKSSSFSISTRHDGAIAPREGLRFALNLQGDYAKTDNFGNSLSGAFNSDYSDISRQALEAIYSDGSADELKAVVNRAQKLSEGSLRSGNVRVTPSALIKLPHSSETLNLSIGYNYTGSKRGSWDDYVINYGSDPNPADRRRQYTDNSPNYHKEVTTQISYARPMRTSFLRLNYDYVFSDKVKDSYMYALERLEDLGIFGVLPDGYQSTLDPTNSFTSATRTNSHTITADYRCTKSREKGILSLSLGSATGIDHQRLDYWRENRTYLVRKTYPKTRSTGSVTYQFGKSDNAPNHMFNNTLGYGINLTTRSPELLHLVDVIHDSDPLNIQEGNPGLKSSCSLSNHIAWQYTPYGKPFYNSVQVSYTSTFNDLVRGYTYDTQTGVRRFRTYNVDGNYKISASDHFNLRATASNFGFEEQLDKVIGR